MNQPSRYRCYACGNLTRFDVVRFQRTTEFHHYTTAGSLNVEDQKILEESIETVTCRWCESGADITEIPVTTES
ncbi:MAG: hypothetical protein QF596_03010 [Acidimicrobiales bacterium]|nr:hypothetical protein [Acidimicrobiales bacterium]